MCGVTPSLSAAAKAAFVSGIPSVIAYDTVKSGDRYGVVFEAVNSDTLGHAIMNDLGHLDDYVRKYVEFAKTIHKTEIIGEDISTLKSFLKKRVTSEDMLLFCEQSEVDVPVDIIDRYGAAVGFLNDTRTKATPFLLYKKLLVSYIVKKSIFPAQLRTARARAMGIRKRTRLVRALSCTFLTTLFKSGGR